MDLQRELKRLETKIQDISDKGFIPEPLLELVRRTCELQLREKSEMKTPEYDRDDLAPADMNVQGAPLLAREHFSWEGESASRLFDELLKLAEQTGGLLKQSAEEVRKAEADGEFDRAKAFASFVQDDDDFFEKWEKKLPETPKFMAFLVGASLAPGVEVLGESIQEHVSKEKAWLYGHCPVCGSAPIISRLLEKEGHRHLTCSFCHVEFRAKRLACPYCGEDDLKKLEYFKADEEPGYCVHVCRTCNGYIKTVDFRELDKISLPLLDDLESLALDFTAAEQGFSRAALSAWGF